MAPFDLWIVADVSEEIFGSIFRVSADQEHFLWNVGNCSSFLYFLKNDDDWNSVQSFIVGAVQTGAGAEVLVRVRVSWLDRKDEKIYRVIQKSRYTESICECKLM